MRIAEAWNIMQPLFSTEDASHRNRVPILDTNIAYVNALRVGCMQPKLNSRIACAERKLMKVSNFLQASLLILGKHRYVDVFTEG
jgi:hypothetical protein